MKSTNEHFSSKIGFILAAAGSAVGIGNLVGFPVNAAKNGGGAFLLLYALFVFFICLPVMIAEMAVGRQTEKDPIGAYNILGKNHRGWNFAGLLAVITPFMITVFYLLITVWLFGYLSLTLVGKLDYLASEASFSEFINNPYMFTGMIAVGAIIHFILAAGVQNGIERASKILMPMLFVMLLMLVAFVLTFDNALAGIKFFIIPEFNKLTPPVVNGALSQAFFSLSLGMGILITYGSYINRNTSIVSSAKLVALTDTIVAFTAGLMILPAVFSFNPDIHPEELSNSSVSLIFTFLPKIFLALQSTIGYVGASAVAAFFFLLVFFAAITSLVSIIEVPVAYLTEERRFNRTKSLIFIWALLAVLTLLASFSFGLVGWLTEFINYAGATRSFFDVIIDVFYETILPLNGLLICLFVSYRWQKSNFNEELAQGSEHFYHSWFKKYLNFSLSTFIPMILLAIFINTVLHKFFAIDIFSM